MADHRSESADEVVLLTGGHGFVGRRLATALARTHPRWRLAVCGGPHDADGLRLDVTDADQAAAVVAQVRPTMAVHLAAVSAITASIHDPRAAWRVNFEGTLNLAQALADHAPDCHLLFVSSAEVYGRSLATGTPVTEEALLEPVNPYAASKAAADILVRQRAYNGLSATVARPFNHTGAGQVEAFVVPSFAGQIARIEQGLQPPVLQVGSLDDERDFLDVDDVVDAYVGLLEARGRLEPGGVFNVASGTPRRIGDILEHLLGLARVAIEVRIEPVRLRSSAAPKVVGDASKLRAAIDWRPTCDFTRTLQTVLDERRSAALAPQP